MKLFHFNNEIRTHNVMIAQTRRRAYLDTNTNITNNTKTTLPTTPRLHYQQHHDNISKYTTTIIPTTPQHKCQQHHDNNTNNTKTTIPTTTQWTFCQCRSQQNGSFCIKETTHILPSTIGSDLAADIMEGGSHQLFCMRNPPL